jgi:hypothetical protein
VNNFIQGLGTIFGFNKNFNQFSIDIFGGSSFSRMRSQKLLDLVISSPAMIKVIALQCDMFSLGAFYYYENGKERKMPEEVANLLKKPNYQQNIRQFLWDWMFWNMIGNSWVFIRDKNFTPKMFSLNPFEMEFPTEVQEQGLILTVATFKGLQDKKIRYSQRNGKTMEIEFKELVQFMDLSNTNLRDINGMSRLDSLYKVILNAEESLKSLNINTRFAGKFIVSGETSALDVTKRMLTPTEKTDIEQKVESDKQSVHAVKSQIEIRRFVENMKSMELNKSYLDSYFIIGNMYNIPRDVLEAYGSSTYENQEKARSSHISYCLDPKGQELGKGLSDFFGLKGEIVMSWDHLPFVQVMEAEREDTKKKKLENLKFLLELGVDKDEAMAYVDVKFKKFDYEKPKPNQGTPEQEGSDGEPEAEAIDSAEDPEA